MATQAYIQLSQHPFQKSYSTGAAAVVLQQPSSSDNRKRNRTELSDTYQTNYFVPDPLNLQNVWVLSHRAVSFLQLDTDPRDIYSQFLSTHNGGP